MPLPDPEDPFPVPAAAAAWALPTLSVHASLEAGDLPSGVRVLWSGAPDVPAVAACALPALRLAVILRLHDHRPDPEMLEQMCITVRQAWAERRAMRGVATPATVIRALEAALDTSADRDERLASTRVTLETLDRIGAAAARIRWCSRQGCHVLQEHDIAVSDLAVEAEMRGSAAARAAWPDLDPATVEDVCLYRRVWRDLVPGL